MKLWNNYHVATSIEDALEILAQHEGRAQVVAGGTDLLLDIQQGNHAPVAMLVDITRIPEITRITVDTAASTVLIGAGVTHSAIEAHPALASGATCLTESCGVVGGPQVRNVATLGGNIAHALPAADGTLSLVALRARAEVATSAGRAWRPIESLFVGAGKSAIDPRSELITRFEVPLARTGEASAFKRIMRPQGVALPILGCAIWVALDDSRQVISDVSICLGPTGPVPAHAALVEDAIRGLPATPATIAHAAQVGRATLHPRTSKYRATVEYRIEMIEVLIRDALTMALQRASIHAASTA
jgi:carbon-monoxide dehydrogenase medium subunit